jgi:hypothetical protein
MSQVWVIKFVDERGRELLTGPVGTGLHNVRMASTTQGEVELKADEILNRWLKANPGRVGSYSISLWVQESRLRDIQVRQIRELLA